MAVNQPRFLWTSVSSTVRRRICTICTCDATFPYVIYFLNRIYQKPVPRLFLPPQVVREVPEPETGRRALFPFVLASAECRFPVGLCIWGAHPNLCLVWPLGCHAQVSANGPLVNETVSHFLSQCSSLKVKTKNERSEDRGPRLHHPGWKVKFCASSLTLQGKLSGRLLGVCFVRSQRSGSDQLCQAWRGGRPLTAGRWRPVEDHAGSNQNPVDPFDQSDEAHGLE